MRTYVIIPGYNEAKYLPKVLKKVTALTDQVIYVNDGSEDQSSAIAKRFLKHVLVHKVNLGKGAALKTGCEYAFKTLKADAVIFMDADDQHDPREIKRFAAELQRGVPVVFGARKYSQNMPLMRLLGNRFASIFFNILFHQYIPDIPCGFKAMTRPAYNKIKWESPGYEVEMEIAFRVAKKKLKHSVIEIESIYHDADKGMTSLDAAQIAWRLIQWKFGL